MASYAAGDIVLLEFPFTDTAGSKRRPALILLDTGDDDIVVARVTGQLSAAPQDVTLTNGSRPGYCCPRLSVYTKSTRYSGGWWTRSWADSCPPTGRASS